jgi:hypothetical protein
MRNVFIFIFCFLLPFVSFGIRADYTKDDMKEAYRRIAPMLLSGRFRTAARTLCNVYAKYISVPENNINNTESGILSQEKPYWVYLDDAIRSCGNARSSSFKSRVMLSMKAAFPAIAQID